MLGNIVSIFRARRFFKPAGSRGRNLDQIKADALALAQGIRQFHDASCFLGS